MTATAVLLLPLAACSDDDQDPSPAASSDSSPSASASGDTDDAAPSSSQDLVLSPGALEPITVGMTKAQSEPTGLFEYDIDDEGCVIPMKFKDSFKGADVIADQSGTIVSLGSTSKDGPRTDKGLGVGSTFGELIETYGGDLSAPEKAGYEQVGVYVQDGDKWLGFLFGEVETVERANNDPGVTVTFAEATVGDKPALMRDGC